jgi:hypothetical protein
VTTPFIYDRVRETTTTSGTGAVSLAGAATGYRAFSAVLTNGQTCPYVIADQGGANWEVGTGTYNSSGNTLSRTTVLASSNSGSLVTFGSNTKDVFLSLPAEYLGLANNGIFLGQGANLAPAVLAAPVSYAALVASSDGAPQWTAPSGQILTYNGSAATWVMPNLSPCNCRLTLTSGTPVTTADVTAATTLYLDPYLGNQIWIYGGAGIGWLPFSFSELSIPSTVTVAACAINTTTHTITLGGGLASGSTQLVRGMVVTGIGISGTCTIATIVDATHVTVSGGSLTTEASTNLTFKLPASSAFDVFLVQGLLNNTPFLQWGPAWTTAGGASPARANAVSLFDGIWTNTSAINSSDYNGIAAQEGTLVGSVYVGTTAGQLNDWGGAGSTQAGGQRFVANVYNQFERHLYVTDLTSSWSCSSATWQQADQNAGNKVEYFCSVPGNSVRALAYIVTSTGSNPATGVGIDSTTVNSARFFGMGGTGLCAAEYVGNPGIGYHALNWLQAQGTGTGSFFSGNAVYQSGMVAEVFA